MSTRLPAWFVFLWWASLVVAAILTVIGLGWSNWPVQRVPAPPHETPAAANNQAVSIGNGISIVNNGTIHIQIADFGDVPINRVQATDPNGAADVEFVLLHGSAIWAFGSDSNFIRPTGAPSDLTQLLTSPEFLRRFADYSDILCLGTSSSASEKDLIATIPLSRDRAVRLCRMVIASRPTTSARVSAIGLGYHTVRVRKNSAAERAQRAAVLVGARSMTGSPNLVAIVRQLMSAGAIEGFDFRSYSALVSSDPLIVDQLSSQTIGP